MEETTLLVATLLMSMLPGPLLITAATSKDAATAEIPEGVSKNFSGNGQPLRAEHGSVHDSITTEITPGYGLEESKTIPFVTKETTEHASSCMPDVCPSVCECGSSEVHCSRANLSVVPNGLGPSTTYLDLGHNHITVLLDDDLANRCLTELTSLILDNNKITMVSQHAFRGLTKLSLLQLAGNLIGHLHPNIFQGNVELKHVDLTGNPLTFSTEGPIFYTKSLEWVDFDQCNLTNLPTEAFHDTPSLRYVNLNGNHIRKLYLSQFSKLGYLRYVKLLGNPLQCDCEMKPLWRWFTQQNINADGRCATASSGSVTLRKYFETLECKK